MFMSGGDINVEVFDISAGTEYYLGVTDVFYDEGRPRAGEVRERRYRLWLWWGECIFWDDNSQYWSSRGCHMTQASSYSQAQCTCNHLTAFTARFLLTPNKIEITNVEEFFE